MEFILTAFGQLRGVVVRADDDYVDKLNRRYTTFMLCAFAIVVSGKQYVGDPITCWCPAEFKDNYEDFTNKYCWVHNTYHVAIGQKRIPDDRHERAYIGYYQWVPIVLLLQALLFYLPCLVWRTLNNKTGIDVDNIVRSATEAQQTAYTEQKEKVIGYITRNLDRYLTRTRRYQDEDGCRKACRHRVSPTCCLVCGSRRFDDYLAALYLLSKALYTANAVGQLFLLDAFLSTDGHAYGYEVTRDLLGGRDRGAPRTFPRVTLCDFSIRDLNNIRSYTVQCVLPLNFFNEKIYLVVWFWLVLVAAANVLNALTWLVRVLAVSEQTAYIQHRLASVERADRRRRHDSLEKARIRQFVSAYLKKDGVLVLRLVEQNTNALVVSEITSDLYTWFQNSKMDREYDTDMSDYVDDDLI